MRKGKKNLGYWVAGVFCLFLLLILTGCEKKREAERHLAEEIVIHTDYLEEKSIALPYFGLLAEGREVQPLVGTATRVEISTYQKAAAICGPQGFQFWAKGDWESYWYRMELYHAKEDALIWQQGYFERSFQPEGLSEGVLYVLRLVLQTGEMEFFYDLPFFYREGMNFESAVSGVLGEILGRRQEQELFMGEAALRVDEAAPEGSIWGQAKVVTAIRKEGGFEYLDKFYRFEADGSGSYQIEERIRNKKRGFYDKSRKSVVLGTGGQWEQDGERFVYIEDGEVYAGDQTKVQVLYRRDEINEDYLTDELNTLCFRPIGWKEGSYYFLGYGTFTEDIPELGNRRGVAFFEWDGQERNILYFAEVADAELQAYVESRLFIAEERAEIYWLRQGSYLIVDLAKKRLTKSEVPFHAELAVEQALLYWQAEEGKKNQAVLWSRMPEQAIYSIYQEGKNQRLLGIGQKGIYVGEYQLEDTLEYLDRQVVYPLQRIVLYSPEGKEKKALTPPAGSYFGLPEFSGTDRGWVSVLKRKIGAQTHRGEQRVDYVEAARQTFDFSDIQTEKPEGNRTDKVFSGGRTEDFYGEQLRLLSGASQRAEIGEQKIAWLHWQEAEQDSYYLIQAGKERILADSLRRALLKARKYPVYQIFYTNGTTKEKLFDSEWQKTEARIGSFRAMPQMPELPRGCEVTALSMLLQYHDPTMPDRFALAKELTEYSAPFQRTSVYQVDMKEAFAGSMYNFKEPGLGVYIEPISLLARRYLGSRAHNITGAEFSQLLTLVSHGLPVQIIISDMAAAVPSSLKTSWHTENGYMEITYREHSVVVVGFDSAFVYYADPLTGGVERSARKAFEEGYLSFGKQAMVIMEESK